MIRAYHVNPSKSNCGEPPGALHHPKPGKKDVRPYIDIDSVSAPYDGVSHFDMMDWCLFVSRGRVIHSDFTFDTPGFSARRR